MMNQYKKYKGIIEKITLEDATFKKSSQKVIEPTFINYFYGNNGTGKSTVARALKSPACLTWSGGNAETDFVIRVFSRDFVDGELKFGDSDPSMPSVLTIGKEFVDIQGQLDEKRTELKKLQEQHEKDKALLTALQERRISLRNKFIEDCWEKGKAYKAIFGGSGIFSKKELFADKVRLSKAVQHDFAELEKRFKTATDQNARTYNRISPPNTSGFDAVEQDKILEMPIISTSDTDFSRFLQKLDALPWVKQGHDHYADKADGKCPYCQQSMTPDIKAQIAACFDEKYSEDCAKVVAYQRQYISATSSIVSAVKELIETMKSLPQSFADITECEKFLALIEKTVAENIRKIDAKISKPSETFQIALIQPHIAAIHVHIMEANNSIVKHNKIIEGKKYEYESCLLQVAEFAAFELKSVVARFAEDEKDNSQKIQKQNLLVIGQNDPMALAQAKITELNKKAGGSKATIAKINELLKTTGFRGFSLVAHESVPDRYNVVRDDGTTAKKLSEGEKNFIAFLYFYHLVQGAWMPEDLHKGKIIVIDDPVSSMDSGVLSIVGSLTREFIDDCFNDGAKHNIKQIFILTHNPYFHNAVSQQMLRPDEGYFKKIAFFEIKKGDDNISSVSPPCIQESRSKDPDIPFENVTPVQNSYSALWQEYKEAKLPSSLLHIINRIADYYFFRLCIYDREDLKNRVTDYIGADTSKLKLVNELLQYVYETEDSIGGMIYYPSAGSIEDYKDAFRTVFKAIGQESHYAKMSGEG